MTAAERLGKQKFELEAEEERMFGVSILSLVTSETSWNLENLHDRLQDGNFDHVHTSVLHCKTRHDGPYRYGMDVIPVPIGLFLLGMPIGSFSD